MDRLTTDTLELAPIGYSQSHARKARHTVPACKCETRYTILSCTAQKAIPECIAKVIVYKGLHEPRTAEKLWESEEPNTEH